MKSLIVIMASLLFSGQTYSGTPGKAEITDSFEDKVKSITDEDKEVTIRFALHAAIYRLPKSHPQFEQLKATLENRLKNEKKIKVVAIIPTMEIKEIKQ